MGFQAFCRFLVTALVAVTFVQATPFWAVDAQDSGLSRRDTVISQQCKNLVYGSTRVNIGTVCVTLSGGSLAITYTITASGWSFTEVHAWVGTSIPTVTAPGQFPYSSGNGKCTISGSVATCTVSPIPNEWRGCSGSLYIVAHAAVTGPGGTSQTAWDDGTCYPDSNGNCAKYFTVTRECQCPILYSYSPITTSTTYLVTTINTITVSCSTTPSASLTTATCTNSNAGGTETISTTTSVNLVCPSPT